jgi:hypothetical protein
MFLFLCVISVFGILFSKILFEKPENLDEIKQYEEEIENEEPSSRFLKEERFSSSYALAYMIVQIIKIISLTALFEFDYAVIIFLAI